MTEFIYDVFLSHSRRDRERVRGIAERLRDDGLRVWFDETGNSVAAEIDAGLEQSRVLVRCLSGQAYGDEWRQ